jgi:hypothetical protein
MDNKLLYDISGEVNSKYIKYKNFYKPNILYWGLGIENELYLEFCNKMYEFNKEDLIKKCKPTILIETHQFQLLEKSDIFLKLIDLGYKINKIDEGSNDFIMKI